MNIFKMPSLSRIAALPIALVSLAYAAQAQTSRLYLNDGEGYFPRYALQGGVATSYGASVANGEFALAVSGDIRMLGAYGGSGGHQYTLAGAFTGTTYSNGHSGCAFDGTTDGTHNYLANQCEGTVVATDRDWNNPFTLFAVEPSGFPISMSITYDGVNNTLWTAGYSDGLIREYSMAGVVLSTFQVPGAQAPAALAFDPADQTLWFFDQWSFRSPNSVATFYQYSRGGALLQTQYHPELNSMNILGGEFDEAATATPEPASMVLLATGLLGIGAASRRRKANAD